MTTAERAAHSETIAQARALHEFERARALFVEYAEGLNVDLCFQGFAQELASLPGAYAPPRGRLLLAGGHAAFGCVALRPLDPGLQCGSGVAAAKDESVIGEVKRLYGQGWGERLARAILDEARGIGYREVKLDTLESMTPARALYAGLGFRECAPYYENPLAGVVYMSLAL
jgi:GNAT superfamily N-acetyltransferase